ncbi:MAG TPA: DUF2207 domain-containing protein [Aeromicrobium sp.]|nr:DUF2207 domain-containing protein [Aeromicrobium sp.]
MSRLVLRIGAAIAAIALIFFPALGSFSTSESYGTVDPVVITNYDAIYNVAADGTLLASETIEAEFPGGRHGIFRYWDLADADHKSVRYLPKDISIKQDGGSVPVEMSWEKGRTLRVAKIGDANQTLEPGKHTYTITYRIDGVLGPAKDGNNWDDSKSAFNWQVIAAGWSMRMEKATIKVALPKSPETVSCHLSDSRECEVLAAKTAADGKTVLRMSAADISPNTAMRFMSTLDIAAPDRTSVPWPIALDPVFGKRPWGVLAALALAAAAFGASFRVDRRTVERKPNYPVMFEPPAGLGPVQTVFAKEEQIPKRALTATLMHLAEQGHVDLVEHNGDWTVTSKLDETSFAKLDPPARQLVTSLGLAAAGSTFSADGSVSAGKTLQSAQSAIGSATRLWATSSGEFTAEEKVTWWRVGIILAAIAAGLLVFLGAPGITAAPFVALVVGGVGVFAVGAATRRTQSGREVWSRAGGFERFLSTDSAKDRFDFSGRKELYTSFIPYAIAFNVADKWANKYKVSTGETAPIPVWYGGGHAATSSGLFGSSDPFASFESSLSSSISAYTATQSSSSGGGFSGGGGGGGGGGGSW